MSGLDGWTDIGYVKDDGTGGNVFGGSSCSWARVGTPPPARAFARMLRLGPGRKHGPARRRLWAGLIPVEYADQPRPVAIALRRRDRRRARKAKR